MSGFRAAVEAGDPDAMLEVLHPDVTFGSPVVFKPYEGRDAVMVLLRAVFEVFQDFRYIAEVSEGDREILLFEARVGDRQLQGVDIIRSEDGQVIELIVMVRPMSGMHALAEAMRVRLETASA